MKPRAKSLCLGALLIAALTASAADAGSAAAPGKAAKPAPASPLSPRFKQVRDRITDLYQHRNQPPPSPDERTNPFRAPGSAAVVQRAPGSAGSPAVVIPPAATNAALLKQGVATLKVSGTFQIGGTAHLVINGRPYKEGDVLQTQAGTETVYLRVREIARNTVTLALHDAETTLKF